MESFEVFQEIFSKCSPKILAPELGLKEPSVYKWSAQGELRLNPLDRIVSVMQTSGNLLPLHWLCEQFGGYFVHNPEIKNIKPRPLTPAQNKLVHEFAQMLAFIASEVEKNSLGKDVNKVRKRWEELKSVTESFVVGCEKGTFEAYHAHMNNPPKPPPEFRHT